MLWQEEYKIFQDVNTKLGGSTHTTARNPTTNSYLQMSELYSHLSQTMHASFCRGGKIENNLKNTSRGEKKL
jgi:hypothetical protein